MFLNQNRMCVLPGKRSAEGIVQWLKRRTGPGAQVLDSVKAAAQFIDSRNITVVGFFDVRMSVSLIHLTKSHKYIQVSLSPICMLESGKRAGPDGEGGVSGKG